VVPHREHRMAEYFRPFGATRLPRQSGQRTVWSAGDRLKAFPQSTQSFMTPPFVDYNRLTTTRQEIRVATMYG
jgi:hypothetical protein